MKVLVTGPDGFVGSAVCEKLVADGFAVRGAQWRVAPLAKGCESVVVGDINATTDWAAALDGIETVIHLAARVHIMQDTAEDPLTAFREVNVAGTRQLAEAAVKAGVKRFVFVSSVKVNGESTTGRGAFSEDSAPAPEDPYGVSKWEAEVLLRKLAQTSGLELVILRPPLLYGPGVKANLLKLIQAVDKGIPLPLGSIKNKRSLLGLANFADLISKCVTDERAAGETFTVCDGDDVSSPELVRRIAQALGKKPRLLAVPEGAMKLAGKLTGKSTQVQRLCSSLQIDSSHVRKTLNWAPPYTMKEELEQVASWFMQHG